MTDETKDAVPAEGGEPTKPKVDPSAEGGEQGSPGSASELEALSTIVKDLEGRVRALQSEKDRGVARVQKDLSEMKDELEKYYQLRHSGVSDEDARKSLILDEIIAERMGVPGQERAAPEPVMASDDSLKPALELAGLDANDPDVIKILRTTPQPEQQTRIMLLGLERKQAREKPPSPGAAMTTGGGSAVAGETLETVDAELTAALNEPVKDHKKIRELRVKHEELLKQQ